MPKPKRFHYSFLVLFLINSSFLISAQEEQENENKKEASALYEQGFQKNEAEDFQAALNELNQAIQLDPQKPQYYHARGNAQAGLRYFQKAIKDYEHAIELEPENGEFYFSRGLAQFIKAIKDYDQAISRDPQNAKYF